MKYLIFSLITVFYISCSESSIVEDKGACINMKIAAYDKLAAEHEGFGASTEVPQTISKFDHEGKTYYFIDFGIAFDAPGYIFDDTCEEVCQFQSLIVNDNLSNCSEFNESLSGAIKIWPTP